jgi:transposase
MSCVTTQHCQTCSKIEQLTQENKQLKTEITRLTRALLKYENPHTPPSMRIYKTHKNNYKPTTQKRFPGPPKKHKGTTRQKQKTPTTIIQPPNCTCPNCQTLLTQPTAVKHHLIEELPNRQKRQIIDFIEHQYQCPNCRTKTQNKDPQCPPEGIFGVNAQCQTTLLKFEQRLPFEKVAKQMQRHFDLPMSQTTVLEIAQRVSQTLRPDYFAIREHIRSSDIVNIDETSIKVDGVKWWIWTFVTKTDTFYVIRHSRGKKVLLEVLGEDFKGYVGCDGWGAYPAFTEKIQRCWAHLLREAKDVSKNHREVRGLYKSFKGLFDFLTESLVGDPPIEERLRLVLVGKERLRLWLDRSYKSGEVLRFMGKVERGFEFWFTFVLVRGLEATNNVAERALRELVVQRKIMGTLRNEKGAVIYETMMSLIVTWDKQGLDTFEQMKTCLINNWTKS